MTDRELCVFVGKNVFITNGKWLFDIRREWCTDHESFQVLMEISFFLSDSILYKIKLCIFNKDVFRAWGKKTYL
jgi:hypothetical protein